MSEHNQNMCDTCNAHSHGCCGHHHHKIHLVRWVLFIIVACMIFSLGMKVGEFKGMIDGGEWGRGMHRGGYSYGPAMMYGSQFETVTVQTVPPVKK